MKKIRRKTKESHGAVTKNGKKARKDQKKRKSHRDGLIWQNLNKLKQYPPQEPKHYPAHDKT